MRRLSGVVLGAVVLLSGCDALRNMGGGTPTVVATAAGQELTVERLAQLMVGAKGVPLAPEAADFIANVWVDHTLLAQSLASGRDFLDSATAVEVMWPELVELRGTRWHDSLLAHRVPLTPAVVDSIYTADEMRLLQHILVRVEPNAEPPARAAGKRRADAALARVRAGGDFARLAGELSDDPGSKLDGGYLPPAPRGKWVTAFDSAGWALAPGAMTGLVETPFGYHIIRRPPVAEIRNRLVVHLREALGQQLDSTYLDSLGIQRKLKVAKNAPELVREALGDKGEAIRSTKPLATYTGGQFTVAQLIRWVTALGPQWAADLPTRPDSGLTQFVKLLAQNQLLLAQADSAGIQVDGVEWASMNQRYHQLLDTLRLSLDLYGGDITDPTVSKEERGKVAALKVATFWDRVATGSGRPRPIPGPVSFVLRRDGEYHVDRRGVAAAVQRAQALKARVDSTGRPIGGAPAPGGQ